MTTAEQARQQFLEDYRKIRHAEGRGSQHSEYYRRLPDCAQDDPNRSMWAMRAKTFRYFRENILAALEKRLQRPLQILDLGAGNCWLSNKLAWRGHRVTAIDIFADNLDGLGAARHYTSAFQVIQADFDDLPIAAHSYDLAIFNASFHYSTDYQKTLAEVRRCLRPGGTFVILDSPVYRCPQDGRRMVEEKHSRFLRQYGFRSDALNSLEFLDRPTIQALASASDVEWTFHKPWYGIRWHLRPLRAFLLRRRRPSNFYVLTGRFRRS